jgi:hypothetical protein
MRQRKARATGQLSELQEQILFVEWLRLKRIIFYAIPNGGKRDIVEASKLKRAGVSPGTPDVCIPMPSKGCHGLYIELKREHGGIVSFEQIGWIKLLRSQGYCAEVARGFGAAKELVEWYFDANGVAKPFSVVV